MRVWTRKKASQVHNLLMKERELIYSKESCEISLDRFTLYTIMIDESQLAKHRRQQCINLLDKITKNIFRMLRDEQILPSQMAAKFSILYKKLEHFDNVYLDTDYHRQTRKYIHGFAKIMR